MRGLKKLPIGISTFKDIISENYTYVDKTELVLNLIENGRYYFLSRPRRFGKSLLLDTLRTVFSGDKGLFQGLAIEHRYDFKSYPVIYISFASGDLTSKNELIDKWQEILVDNEEKLGVSCQHHTYDRRCFAQLIRLVYKKYGQKVVVFFRIYYFINH
jgi:hypothetical protein